VTCAWEYVQPSVHPGRQVFGLPAHHTAPDSTFQGQMDAVYTWTDADRLVAFDTQPERNQFTPEIVDRLVAWAYLQHQRGCDEVEGLEAWMLGQAERVLLPAPDRQELRDFERKHHDLLRQAVVARHMPDAGDWLFEARPSAAIGGSHCDHCPAQLVCPQGGHADADYLQRLSALHPDCDTEHGIQGRVLGVADRQDVGSHEARVVSLATAEGALRITGDAEQIEGFYEQGLRVGEWVRLTQLHVGKKASGKRSYAMVPATEFRVLEHSEEQP
jgi:hypothetical protein